MHLQILKIAKLNLENSADLRSKLIPWSEWTLIYYKNLRRDWSVPDGVEILGPFGEKEVRRLRSEF